MTTSEVYFAVADEENNLNWGFPTGLVAANVGFICVTFIQLQKFSFSIYNIIHFVAY